MNVPSTLIIVVLVTALLGAAVYALIRWRREHGGQDDRAMRRAGLTLRPTAVLAEVEQQRATTQPRDSIFAVLVARQGDTRAAARFIVEAWARARFPQRVFFGIALADALECDRDAVVRSVADTRAQQAFWRLVAAAGAPPALASNLRATYGGPLGACALVRVAETRLHRGEKWLLHAEPWVGLREGWDTMCESEWKRLRTPLGILTHPTAGRVEKRATPFFAFERWSGRGTPVWAVHNSSAAAHRPLRALARSPEFAFGSATLLAACPHEGRWGALPDRDWAWGMSVRLASRGATFFTPSLVIAYARGWSPRTPSQPYGSGAQLEGAYADLWAQLGIVGGSQQSVTAIAAMLGIDHGARTATLYARLGFLPPPEGAAGVRFVGAEVLARYGSWSVLRQAEAEAEHLKAEQEGTAGVETKEEAAEAYADPQNAYMPSTWDAYADDSNAEAEPDEGDDEEVQAPWQ